MILKNQKGQMAVFIALFFQVLFVFFAMAINVGLVVHDKINLQNAVDLAAYYGAAKQAEVLNQIAHINYQMRQNYKLFAWRYRVLGTLGLNTHPYGFFGVNSLLPDSFHLAGDKPSVCVAHPAWQEYLDLDGISNFCREPILDLPNIVPATGGANFIPGYSNLVNYTITANNQFARICRESGILNWMFAARLLAHYRVDGLMRKNKILRLAQNLTQPDPLDLRNESIEAGVRKTFENNLTNSNIAGVSQFQYFNSVGQGSCANVATLLPEIKINPVIMFADIKTIPGNNDCRIDGGVPNRPAPNRPAGPSGLTNLPSGFIEEATLRNIYLPQVQELMAHWSGEPNTDMHSSIGYEKNPWCMIYSGVRATTTVRKPFSPAGPVVLEARGFAQPFGGRIGPWYGRTWPQGSPNSIAGSRTEMVDPLLPSRDVPSGGPSTDPTQDIANHSRYPGDALGLSSGRAINAMFETFRSRIQLPPVNPQIAPMAWNTYNHLGGTPNLENTGDSLARDSSTKRAVQRDFEIAALAPDVFDALYYSIEPAYHANYFSPLTTNNGAPFADNQKIYDFGSSKDNGQPNSTPQFNVINQIERARSLYHPQVEYIVKDWKNLLTSWHQAGAVNYGMDPAQFGRCEVEVTQSTYPTTGNCIQGGRTGYAVKNVSADFLQSSDHELGGGAGNSGPILNPPNF